MAEETRSFAALLPAFKDSVQPGSTPAWHQPNALHSPLVSLVVDPVGHILNVIRTKLVTKGRHGPISVGNLPWRTAHSEHLPIPYTLQQCQHCLQSDQRSGQNGHNTRPDAIAGGRKADLPLLRQLNRRQVQGLTRTFHLHYALLNSLVLMFIGQVT